MVTVLIAFVCLGIGLYAGKYRASGLGWCTIFENLFKDTVHTIKNVWNWAATPFQKGDPNSVNGEKVLS